MSFQFPPDDTAYPTTERPNRLSQNGQMLAIGVYGGLLVVGFFFGIVAGYEPSKPPPLVVPTATDRDTARRDDPKPEVPKPAPKAAAVPAPEPEPRPEPPPKVDPPRPEPAPEPKKADPPKPEPKKVEPKKADPAATVPVVSFEKDVKPILRTYCFNCHGAAGKPKGDVDLTSLAKITDPKNPPILKPGDADKSAIYASITEMSMPPAPNKRPGKGETEVIRNWIAGGAKPRRRRLPGRRPSVRTK